MKNFLRAPASMALLLAFSIGASFAPAAVQAQSTLAAAQAGYHRLMIGDTLVTALSDGTVPLPTSILTGIEPAHLDELLKQAHLTAPLSASVNVYLIDLGARKVLVDAGAGSFFGPTLNKLRASLHAAGYRAEQVTDILVTHIHTDHTGGLIDKGRRVFPNAQVHVAQRELDFWLSAENLERAPPAQKQFFQQAQAALGPYVKAGRIKTFDGAVQLFPGLRTQPAQGHTPGHTIYVLERQGQKLAFWGDILHVGDVQFPEPDVTVTFDVDSPAAATERKKVFNEAAAQALLVAPSHMSFPGIGHLVKDGAGYRWMPLPYVNDAR